MTLAATQHPICGHDTMTQFGHKFDTCDAHDTVLSTNVFLGEEKTQCKLIQLALFPRSLRALHHCLFAFQCTQSLPHATNRPRHSNVFKSVKNPTKTGHVRKLGLCWVSFNMIKSQFSHQVQVFGCPKLVFIRVIKWGEHVLSWLHFDSRIKTQHVINSIQFQFKFGMDGRHNITQHVVLV